MAIHLEFQLDCHARRAGLAMTNPVCSISRARGKGVAIQLGGAASSLRFSQCQARLAFSVWRAALSPNVFL